MPSFGKMLQNAMDPDSVEWLHIENQRLF